MSGWLTQQLAAAERAAELEARAKEAPHKTLQDAMIESGYEPPKFIEPGKFVRFAAPGKKSSNKSAWVQLFDDGLGATYGDFISGSDYFWSSKGKSRGELSPEDRAAIERAKKARADALEEQQIEATKKARDAWNDAKAAKEHQYLSKKEVKPYGARVTDDGVLMLPITDAAGNVQNVQRIWPDGKKRFWPGAKVNGGVIMVHDGGGDIIVTEGWATAASLADHNKDCTIVAALNTSNMPKIVKAIRDRQPGRKIIIAGDDDRATAGNPGRTLAEKLAKEHGCLAVFPEWPEGADENLSDFNDLWVLTHDSALMSFGGKMSDGAKRLFDILTADEDAMLAAIASQRWLIDDVLPSESFGIIYGASGTGKSFVTLDISMLVAAGLPWQGYESGSGSARVVYVSAEGGNGMRIRKKAWEQYHNRRVQEMRLLTSGVIIDEPTNFAELTEALDGLVRSDGEPVQMIVLDTLARTMAGDENTVKDASAFIRACDALKERYGCTIMVVHHTGKDADRGARGSSAFRAASDFEIQITGSTDSMLRVACTKAKDVEPFNDINLVMEVVELDGMIDTKGRKFTTLVPRASTWGDKMREATKIKPEEQAIIDMIKEKNEMMSKSEIRVGFYSIDEIKSLTQEYKRQRLKRSLDSLVDAGLLIEEDEGYFDLPDSE